LNINISNKRFTIFTLLLLISGFNLANSGCSSGGIETVPTTAATPPASNPPASSCSVTTLESQMTALLAAATSEVDFSYAVERADGRRFTYNRGASTMQTRYESASTSKLVSSVVILRAIQDNFLLLSARPQDHITTWPILNTDSLYTAKLENLLSFTSGFYDEPTCINLAGATFTNCVNSVATSNTSTGRVPGNEFYYSGAHMQVAGLMVMKAKSAATWTSVFSDFKALTGLFSTSVYDKPSASNPRLAGGMTWTGDEYMAFLKALKNGSILNTASMNTFLADRTTSATLTYSPPFSGLNETWHYGLGYWHECQSTLWNCTAAARISSPGAYGAYPFWDRANNYFGMVARQGSTGTYTVGIGIERAVRSKVLEWVACQ
jgi:CubicO group peptidase (beta-lactamase class C family)